MARLGIETIGWHSSVVRRRGKSGRAIPVPPIRRDRLGGGNLDRRSASVPDCAEISRCFDVYVVVVEGL